MCIYNSIVEQLVRRSRAGQTESLSSTVHLCQDCVFIHLCFVSYVVAPYQYIYIYIWSIIYIVPPSIHSVTFIRIVVILTMVFVFPMLCTLSLSCALLLLLLLFVYPNEAQLFSTLSCFEQAPLIFFPP